MTELMLGFQLVTIISLSCITVTPILLWSLTTPVNQLNCLYLHSIIRKEPANFRNLRKNLRNYFLKKD
jgi:hypothetical protein